VSHLKFSVKLAKKFYATRIHCITGLSSLKHFLLDLHDKQIFVSISHVKFIQNHCMFCWCQLSLALSVLFVLFCTFKSSDMYAC
jgi:hypothetical protein